MSAHKIVIIGDPMVGKTSLMCRIISDDFKENYAPTIGSGCGVWTTTDGNEKIKLCLWDTAGQEKYRSLGRIFYQHSEAALLVVSKAKPQTEESLDSWVREFRGVAGDDCIVAVAANKTDMADDPCADADMRNWARKRGFPYIDTCAKTGQGVKELFQYLALLLSLRTSYPSLKSLSVSPSLTDCGRVLSCC